MEISLSATEISDLTSRAETDDDPKTESEVPAVSPDPDAFEEEEVSDSENETVKSEEEIPSSPRNSNDLTSLTAVIQPQQQHVHFSFDEWPNDSDPSPSLANRHTDIPLDEILPELSEKGSLGYTKRQWMILIVFGIAEFFSAVVVSLQVSLKHYASFRSNE
jgi:hypothetical protein